jgi:hypothetical protein
MAWPTSSSRSKDWGAEVLYSADLEGQFDLLHSYFNDSLNGSTGHGHTGGTNDGPKITLTTGVQGTLPVANGGTGVATLAALLNLVYPVGSIYGNRTDSTNPATLLGFGTWTAIGGFVAGIDGTAEFLSPGQTGGAKTQTHTVSGTTSVDSNPSGGRAAGATPGNASESDLHTHTFSATTSSSSILPPYTSVYLWYRSA